jgi:hypothetical protein
MAKRKASRYPREIEHGVLWSFVPPTYSSLDEFIQAVHQYQLDIAQEDNWDPAAVVLAAPRVRIRPSFWEDVEDEEEAGELVAELTASDPAGFTAGELLFQVHNLFVEQWGDLAGDYTFFEGFTLRESPDGKSPLYDIDLGS